MTEAKKRKLHSAEFKAKAGLEASRSRTRATDPVDTRSHERRRTSASRLSESRVKPQNLAALEWAG